MRAPFKRFNATDFENLPIMRVYVPASCPGRYAGPEHESGIFRFVVACFAGKLHLCHVFLGEWGGIR